MEIGDDLEIKTEHQLKEHPGGIQEAQRLQRIIRTVSGF